MKLFETNACLTFIFVHHILTCELVLCCMGETMPGLGMSQEGWCQVVSAGNDSRAACSGAVFLVTDIPPCNKHYLGTDHQVFFLFFLFLSFYSLSYLPLLFSFFISILLEWCDLVVDPQGGGTKASRISISAGFPPWKCIFHTINLY
jgi:hypothetical protein